MRFAITGTDGAFRTIDELVGEVQYVESLGFASYSLEQVFAVDAMEVLAIAGREVPRIELHTAVVPIQTRHPVTMAQQALTTQAATGGRFVLGVGVSHQPVIEDMFGLEFDRPYSYMREYLHALTQLVRKRSCVYQGERVSVNMRLAVAEKNPPPILLGAMGPKMLELAGEVADGTHTFLTGPTTLREFTVPTITQAAQRAGRPAPRIAVQLPITVTDDVTAARRRATKMYRKYNYMPSYKAMLDREGASSPVDVSIIGDEEDCVKALRELEDIGVTDFFAALCGSKAERERTLQMLQSLF